MCAAEARRVAVVGGGWAGCASAVGLARAGCTVTLFEAARTLGGRARAVEVNGVTVDNGQHILLGAYRDTLRLLRQVGIDPAAAFLRLPLQMRYPAGSGGMDFVAPRLPAPWHIAVALLRATGLERADKMALARFTTSARWMQWRLNEDCSVAELLERFDQTARLVRLMWEPLCLAALNTPVERASANVFLAVLRDSLGAERAASDMLLPRIDLGALFPAAAARFLSSRGSEVRLGARIEQLAQDGDAWLLDGEPYDAVVLATPPQHSARLLGGLPDTGELIAQLNAFSYEPITTCYLQYDQQQRLPLPFYALVDAAEGHWGQFVFDRGQLDAGHAGMLSVVVSASDQAAALDQDTLAAQIARQLADALRIPALAEPRWSRVITEKRATFACVPNLQRPDNATCLPGLALAGDYTASEYPATLESAVRSAIGATAAILSRRTLLRENRSLSQSDGDHDSPSVQ